jgi:MFS family permease
MTSASQALAPSSSAVRAGRLSATAAFYLQASIIVSFLAASSAPTPLYARYQTAWGFSPITVTVVFGIYALAVLTSLLTLGSLSDFVGRRPVLLASLALQAVAALVFVNAGGVPALLAARVIQGVSTGAAVSALGAGMLDIDRAKGTIANALGPMTGTASGALGSGLLVQYLPAPTKLVYLVLFAIFVAQGLGVALMAESSSPRPGALASLKPHFRLPPAVRGPLLVAVPALVAAWSLAGFYGSIAPTLFRRMTGSTSPMLGGLALFVLAAGGIAIVLVLHARAATTLMTVGTAALALGVGTLLVAVAIASIPVFFLGTIIAGMGFGAGFQGAIRTVIPLAAPHERAGVLSVLYLVSYLALGLPAVLGGLRVVYGGGVLSTSREYGSVVIGMSLFALAGTILRRRTRPAHS